MTVILKIKYNNINRYNIPKKSLIFNWIYESIKISKKNFNIIIIIVNKKKIKYLNNLYKNKNYCTNVLTFISPKIIINNKEMYYCDIVICKDIIEYECKFNNQNLYSHWAHIIIHSCLHIIGYKHTNNYQFNIMINKEIEILSKFNFNNIHNLRLLK